MSFRTLHFLIIFLLIKHANSLSFNYSSFQPNTPNIFYQGDAFASNGIQLTTNQLDKSLVKSVGRATYADPIHLWDRKTKKLASFITHFSFIMNALNSTFYGDGLSFFLEPFQPSIIPQDSFGGLLGLFDNASAFDHGAQNEVVAVEFDSFRNTWDPSENHIGININSIVSVANLTWNSNIKDGRIANAWIWYDSTTHNLSVFLSYAKNPFLGGNSSLSYIVDLREVLPPFVRLGFSAATGDWVELHTILTWEFNSTLELSRGEGKIGLGIGLAIGITVLVLGVGVFWRKKRSISILRRSEMVFDAAIEDDFERGTGPKRFTFKELSKATNGFSEEGKLGEGGFGGVYKGILGNTNLQVAVKRVSSKSKQGQKEYVSEVKIISRLRHRNLVQLVGWCHEKGDFLLVYEFMPNGSLDSHLFYDRSKLKWPERYKIALGLASALLYLHEEWEQCVVHRDIKSSNIMLDSNYNAKLGDFGLARLVDHDLGSQTTVLAGTMGYLAPECVTTGKASKESDVYSFGVVALEIACGRKPIEPKAELSKLRLVEWVWGLYGERKILEASDKGLGTTFNEREMECLMIVGLWCCHPDHARRPSIRQVISVLCFEAPLPSLPSKQPVATYFAPPMDMCRFTFTTVGCMNTTGGSRSGSVSQCSCTSCRLSGLSSSKALLTFRLSLFLECSWKGRGRCSLDRLTFVLKIN